MLFSATIDQSIKNIANNFMREPIVLEVGPAEKVQTIDEQFIKLDRSEKFSKLREILHQEAVSRVIVFVATKRAAEYVGRKLYEYRMSANYLHGDMRQQKRERIMRDFREGRFRVLVATDVAARGLHIEEVSHIINYDQANDKDTHTHRIGRTGRMGKAGKAITFIDSEPFVRRTSGRGRTNSTRDNTKDYRKTNDYHKTYTSSKYQRSSHRRY